MTMDIFSVMLVLVGSSLVGFLIAVSIMYFADRARARRNKLQPLLGVVLPKEDESA